MAQSFYEKCSWFSAGLREKTEKTSCRRGCCELLRFCRSSALLQDFSPGPACVHEAVKLLEELLADGGCARAASCGCPDSLQDSCSLAAALSSAFLPRRHEDECRPRGALKFPHRLLRGIFLQMDLMSRWHKMTAAVPWIQDLLEVCAAALVPRPRGLCLSCRGRQAVLSEVSAGKTHKPSNRQAEAGGRRSGERGQTSQECRTAADIFKCLHNPEKMGKDELWGAEERPGHRLRPGLLSSVQQLKNSLKKDLETNQLYLGAIETRLSGLERRAQDVTDRLERANLELEAIKQGSVALETLVGRPLPPPLTEDLVVDLWGDFPWSGATGKSHRPGLCRRKGPERRSSRSPPAGGGGAHRREDVQSGLSSCQRHVDALIQQITLKITRMESDIKATSERRQSAR